MTSEAEKRALGLLETIGGEVAEMRGETRANRVAVHQRFDALDADVEVIRLSQQQQGLRLASLPCEAHARDIARHAQRISEAVRRVCSAENTGQIELAKSSERGKVLATICRVTAGVFAALGVIATIAGSLWAALR